MKSALKVALWSALYFAGHSATASFAAKNVATKLVGARNRDGWFRLIYSVLALSGLVALFLAARRLPDKKWYRARGIALIFTGALQLAGALLAFDAVRRVRANRLLGGENALQWLGGQAPPLPPEGQAPRADELSDDRDLGKDGVFALSRNALNFAVIPIFCAWPRMTRNYAAFCAVMTGYCVIGSFLSEARMSARYGRAWQNYKKSGVPFLVPQLPKKDASKGDA